MVTEAMTLGRELLTAVRELTAELRAARARVPQRAKPTPLPQDGLCIGGDRGDGRCIVCTLPTDKHPVTFAGGVPTDWKGKQP